MLSKRLMILLTIICFILYYTMPERIILQGKSGEKPKNYIIYSEKTSQLGKIQEKYSNQKNKNMSNNSRLTENHQMISIALSKNEAAKIKETPGIKFIEEDFNVKANSNKNNMLKNKSIHKKNSIMVKTNNSANEWNVRMIHADKTKKSSTKKRIKIAILDSGVDYGTDINIEPSNTISLIPGEEEMSPLFMDGTGHGNSVAGLIAAKDNNTGITGINPNAEIYSIRVLDDNNLSPVSRIIEGIYIAIKADVNIINMSFGMDTYSEALKQAICDAKKAGILIIASAGNAGENGVQYPAAFEEAMAVGSVEKNGNLAKSSSIGDQIEIVAPGELVRSTGIFHDEIVASGTSLATPQVTAAASLIWEKDPSVSADFVRELLNESANSYGEKQKYGNGLLDVQYALDNYESFKESYKKRNILSNQNNMTIKENKRKVISFDSTNCIEGSWTKDAHAGMLPSNRSILKKGARFPDTNKYTKGMGDNPWWHGFYTTNYIAAYIYETRLANQLQFGGTATYPIKNMQELASAIKNDINNIPWQQEFGKAPTKAQKREFVWGMAIHNLQDAFAHSTFVRNGDIWYRLKHNNNFDISCDNTAKSPERYEVARRVTNAALVKFEKSDHPSGTYNEYSAMLNIYSFKLGNIYKNISIIVGSTLAAPYLSVNYSTK